MFIQKYFNSNTHVLSSHKKCMCKIQFLQKSYQFVSTWCTLVMFYLVLYRQEFDEEYFINSNPEWHRFFFQWEFMYKFFLTPFKWSLKSFVWKEMLQLRSIYPYNIIYREKNHNVINYQLDSNTAIMFICTWDFDQNESYESFEIQVQNLSKSSFEK